MTNKDWFSGDRLTLDEIMILGLARMSLAVEKSIDANLLQINKIDEFLLKKVVELKARQVPPTNPDSEENMWDRISRNERLDSEHLKEQIKAHNLKRIKVIFEKWQVDPFTF